MQFMLKEFKEKCVVLDDENKIYPFLICGVKITLYFLSNYKGIHLQPMTYFYFEREKNEWILNDNGFNFYFDFDNKKLAFISDDYIITEEISGEIRQHKMKHLKLMITIISLAILLFGTIFIISQINTFSITITYKDKSY